MREIKLEPTVLIKQLYQTLIGLIEVRNDYMQSRSFFRKINVDTVILFTREIAVSRVALWEEVNREYPETKGKEVTCNGSSILYKVDEPLLTLTKDI